VGLVIGVRKLGVSVMVLVAIEVGCVSPAAAEIDDGGPLRPCPKPGTFTLLPEHCMLEAKKDWLARPRPLWPLVTFAVLTVAGGVMSPIFALRVGAEQTHPQSQELVRDTDLMIASGILTGVGVVAGVLYYFVGPGKRDKQVVRQARITPFLDGTRGGLSVSGYF
jgi:hypothetical protein